MCIIALKKETNTLPDAETMKRCWNSNRDNAGFAIAVNGELELHKFTRSEDMITATHNAYEAHPNAVMLMHWRAASHGGISMENTHPFIVNDDCAMVHNGVISKFTPTKDEHGISDTRKFNEYVLKNLPIGFQYNDGLVDMIKRVIGYDKMVFIDKSGKCVIINEAAGTVDDKTGCWFSNGMFKEYKHENFTKRDTKITTTNSDSRGLATEISFEGWKHAHCICCGDRLKGQKKIAIFASRGWNNALCYELRMCQDCFMTTAQVGPWFRERKFPCVRGIDCQFGSVTTDYLYCYCTSIAPCWDNGFYTKAWATPICHKHLNEKLFNMKVKKEDIITISSYIQLLNICAVNKDFGEEFNFGKANKELQERMLNNV